MKSRVRAEDPPLPGCPLCSAPTAGQPIETASGSYRHCPVCELIFQLPEQLPDRATEWAEYRLHNNQPADPGYRRFLTQLLTPLMAHLPDRSRGLDFGCGPGPALAAMLRENGFSMALYDPLFHPDPGVLEDTYDFVTATEVVEHLHRPGQVFPALVKLIRPGGWLGLMTELRQDIGRFPNWWYHRDPTHVAFYAPGTMKWIGRAYGLEIQEIGKRVVLFRKPASPARSDGKLVTGQTDTGIV